MNAFISINTMNCRQQNRQLHICSFHIRKRQRDVINTMNYRQQNRQQHICSFRIRKRQKETERQADRQAGRQAGRQVETERQADGQKKEERCVNTENHSCPSKAERGCQHDTVLMAIIFSQILSSMMPALLQQISTAPSLEMATENTSGGQNGQKGGRTVVQVLSCYCCCYCLFTYDTCSWS